MISLVYAVGLDYVDDDLDESLSAISTVLLEASRVNADSDMLRCGVAQSWRVHYVICPS
jgi:hypothetical protein